MLWQQGQGQKLSINETKICTAVWIYFAESVIIERVCYREKER